MDALHYVYAFPPDPDRDQNMAFAEELESFVEGYADTLQHATDEVAAGFVACTGPYQFRRELYRPEETLTLTRYRSYRWPPALFANRSLAQIPQLRFVFDPEQSRGLLSQAGQDYGQAITLQIPESATYRDHKQFRRVGIISKHTSTPQVSGWNR